MLAAVTLGSSPTVAWALWSDSVPVTGTAISTLQIPASSTFTCAPLGLLQVRFNWSAVAGATSYTVFYDSGASSLDTTALTLTLTPTLGSGSAWVRANRNFGSTTWFSPASQTRNYVLGLLCA